jgi:hypothetical protein
MAAKGAQTPSIWHQKLNGFFLRDLDDERIPFCSVMAARTDHERLVTWRRLGRSSTTTRVASSGAPVATQTPPSGGSDRDAPVWRVDGPR